MLYPEKREAMAWTACLSGRGERDEEVERTIYSHLLGRWRARSMGVKRMRLAVLRRRSVECGMFDNGKALVMKGTLRGD